MIQRSADVVVIGAGTAGLNAFREVRKAGRSALLVESGPYGTTCARVGCMPSKLLIAAAERAHDVASADEFGVEVHDWGIDGAAVMRRVRRLRDRFVAGVVAGVEQIPDALRLRGTARFVAPGTLHVGEDIEVEAGAVVLAVGGRPWLPPPFRDTPELVLTSDDVFDLDHLPNSLALIGTGAIGLELGLAYARLGVPVDAFNPFDELGFISDPEVGRAARDLVGEQIGLHLETRVLSARPDGKRVVLAWREPTGEERESHFSRVLVAAGRRPALAPLQLDKAGLPLDDTGMPPWDAQTTQCGDAPVFLAGDASGERAVLHEASDEGRIAGQNAARFPEVTAHFRREPLQIAFTSPQMAVVGTPWKQLPPGAFETGAVSFAGQGRALVIDEAWGEMRVYADRRTGTLLGAELLGPEVEHLAHLLAWAIQGRLPVQRLLEMPVYHPVLEEGLRTALRDLSDRLRSAGVSRCEDLADAPGC